MTPDEIRKASVPKRLERLKELRKWAQQNGLTSAVMDEAIFIVLSNLKTAKDESGDKMPHRPLDYLLALVSGEPEHSFGRALSPRVLEWLKWVETWENSDPGSFQRNQAAASLRRVGVLR